MAGSHRVVATMWAMGPLLAAGFVALSAPTDRDGGECAMLLRAPVCLTRRGFDFECTWSLLWPDLVNTTFTYRFVGGSSNHCPVTVQHRRDNVSAIYACAIPVRQVSMYKDLIIEMKAWRSREAPPCRTNNIVRVEEAVHTEPPRALWARDTVQPGELLAGWAAPEADLIVTTTLTYQLSYSRTRNRTEPTVQTSAMEFLLRGLRPGAPYWLRVRTEPDGETLRGSWSDWSQPVKATPRALPGVLCLQCTMCGLRTLLCHCTSGSPGRNYSIYYRDEELGSEWECGSYCSLAPPSPLTRVRLSVRERDPPCQSVLTTEPFCLADVDPGGSLSDPAKPQDVRGGVAMEMGGRELRLTWSESGPGELDYDGDPDPPCTDVGLSEGEGFRMLNGGVKGGKSWVVQAPEPSEGGGRGDWGGGRGGSEKTEAVITNISERPRWTLAYVIPIALLMSAVFVVIKGRMRSIKQKVWPAVPNLESSFDELFTVFKGNFQEWARPERGDRPAVQLACEVEERLICLVEVVSEGHHKEEQGEQGVEQDEVDKPQEAERQTERHSWSRRKAQNAYVLRGGDVAGGHGEAEVTLLALDLHDVGDEEDDDELDAAAVDDSKVGAALDREDDPNGQYVATASAEDDSYEDATADEDNVAAANDDCNATVDNKDAASTAARDGGDVVAHYGDSADEDNDAIAGNEDAASTHDYFAADDDVADEDAAYTHDYSAVAAADIVDDDDDDAAIGSVEYVGAAAVAATSEEINDDDHNLHRRPLETRSNQNGEVPEKPGILSVPGKHSQDPFLGVELFALRYERVWWGMGGGQPGLGCRPSPVNSLVGGSGGGEEHAGRAATLEVTGSQEITNMAYVMHKEARESASGGYVNAT